MPPNRSTTHSPQGTPLHQGVLAMRRDEWITNPPAWMTSAEHAAFRKLYQIQEQSGLPLSELALRYILMNPQISVTIPGAANIEQLEANVAAVAKGPLPEDLTAQIDSLGLLHYDPRRY